MSENNNTVHEKGSGFGGKFVRLAQPYREKLSKAMPKGAIKQHPSKTYLSTIKAIFITERMNDVFGIGGWDFESEVVDVDRSIEGKLVVLVCGRYYIREFDLYTPIQYGGQEGKAVEMGDIYKSAVTDCMGKCASLWEVGIQVFKGNPESAVGNKSKRLPQKSEDDSNPEGMAKPKIEPIKQPEVADNQIDLEQSIKEVEKERPPVSTSVDEEMLALKKTHLEMFGKKANANITKLKLQMKIDNEAEKRDQAAKVVEEPTTEVPVKEKDVKSFIPTIEDAEEVEQEDVDSAYNIALSKAQSYVDSKTLEGDAGGLIFEAQVGDPENGIEGATADEIVELKKALNGIYKSLKKQEKEEESE